MGNFKKLLSKELNPEVSRTCGNKSLKEILPLVTKKIKVQIKMRKIIKRELIESPFRGWGIKKGRLITSHRYNRLSLLPSGPGEVEQELVV
jgi:hypothetical protein